MCIQIRKYIYVYAYVHVCTCMYNIYIYIHMLIYLLLYILGYIKNVEGEDLASALRPLLPDASWPPRLGIDRQTHVNPTQP